MKIIDKSKQFLAGTKAIHTAIVAIHESDLDTLEKAQRLEEVTQVLSDGLDCLTSLREAILAEAQRLFAMDHEQESITKQLLSEFEVNMIPGSEVN